MTENRARTARLDTRIAPEALAIVKRAAEMEGRSVSDFVVSAARDAAERTIENHHRIRLSIDDQHRFLDLLLDPPEPADALRRAQQAHKDLIRKPQ